MSMTMKEKTCFLPESGRIKALKRSSSSPESTRRNLANAV